MNNTNYKNKYLKYKIKYLNKIKMKGGNPFKYYVLFTDKDGQIYEIILPLFDNKLYLTIGLDIIRLSITNIFHDLIVRKFFPYINILCANIYYINIYFNDKLLYNNISNYNIYKSNIDKNVLETKISKEEFISNLIKCLENNLFFYCTINTFIIKRNKTKGHALWISIKNMNGIYILTVYDDCHIGKIILNFFKNEFDLNIIYDEQCSNLDLQGKIIKKCVNIDEKINIWHQIYGTHIIIEDFYTELLKENIIKACVSYSTLYFLFCLCNPLIKQQIIINFLQYLFNINPYIIIKFILSYHQFIYENYKFILKNIIKRSIYISIHTNIDKYKEFLDKYHNQDRYTYIINPKCLLEKKIDGLEYYPYASRRNTLLPAQEIQKPLSTIFDEPLPEDEQLPSKSVSSKTLKSIFFRLKNKFNNLFKSKKPQSFQHQSTLTRL